MTVSRRFVIAGLSASVGAALSPFTVEPAFADARFRQWLDSFRGVAAKNGVSTRVFDAAFRGITEPDPEVIRKASTQPEFNAKIWQYVDDRVHERSVATGQQMARKHGRLLDSIEGRFGVSRNVLLAIWSMESNYGEFLLRKDRLHNVPQALATLAYADKRRAKYARTQLIAALKILQSGDIDLSHLEGSWAGAMGHTQFIPTSYLAYGVDFDRDGRRDIWSSVPDALATAANLLAKNGWQSGRTWGYEVELPAGKLPAGRLSLAKWEQLGVRRANGRSFQGARDSAELKVPQGRNGPAFLMLKNFHVIKRYNNADKYALAVGMLADRIGGYDGLRQDWSRPYEPLSIAEKEEVQRHLSRYGFYDGEIDGNIGSGSRAAITAFQQRVGISPDGFASKALLKELRSR
ncbi:MAG TPA: lytic murein transglycosylase [Rhizobiaceae bacterium]|nr:lytic murein transglycosylase [Rhizobiaceae bacterium]